MSDDAMKGIVDLVDNAEPYATDDLDGGGPPQPPDDGGDGDGGPSPFGKPDPAVVQACALLDQNDTDNGRRLLNHFGDRWLSVREIGAHIWSGTHWDPDGGDETLQRMAQETARRIKLECGHIVMSPADARMVAEAARIRADDSAEPTAEAKALLGRAEAAEKRNGKRRGDRHNFAVSSGNRNRTMSMISQALPHRSCAPADLDADHMLFNVGNGTLRFRKWVEEDLECPDPDARRMIAHASVEMLPHNPEHLIAKISPCTYDPKAVAHLFLAWLERFQPDAEVRRFIQTAVGRALLGGATTQVLIFLYGDGANGKSVFMEIISEILGGYGGRLKPESIAGALEGRGDQATPDFARLAGKRFVAIAELPRNSPLREGLVKAMTGGEPMPVRHLNKGFFDLLPEFIPFMSGNDLPDVGGLDHGIWRRLKFVLWPVKVPADEQRPLKEVVGEMMAEAPGILNWAIEGALRFLREGLHEPPAVSSLTEAHREDLDPVGAFVTAHVRDREDRSVQARDMYDGFKLFCEANAIRPWTEKTFSLALKKKGFRREDKRVRKWLGIELVDVPKPRSPYGSLDR
ncbi:phage protein [Camelimonas fluminis]|uniref:Phage/plasmid primase, P4 family n=1 Tax=Camelimonas fluminis TaxID=1576911 RepID=A0ABV7UEW8_9HYPH|nr:DNA primase family protein [Camelimonas fluminis]GHE50922.1 phage protein [Camelimonas fluminis]